MDLFRGLKNTNTKPQTPAPASHPLPSSPRLRKKPLAFQPRPLVSIIPVINFLHFTGGSCQAPHCHPAAVRGAQPQGTPGCWWGGTAMPGSPAPAAGRWGGRGSFSSASLRVNDYGQEKGKGKGQRGGRRGWGQSEVMDGGQERWDLGREGAGKEGDVALPLQTQLPGRKGKV